ncbi:MAG: acetyl-CoA hydrolase/transferase family protein [Propionibacteriaceae bacterium]
MRIVDEATLTSQVSQLPANPRVVVTGNFAVPVELLTIIDKAIPEYRLFMLNANGPIPDREGVTHESPFVGPSMRKAQHSKLDYIPSRLSMVPRYFKTQLPPDLVVIHTSKPQNGTVSLGIEVNVLPDAIEAAKARGALVIAQMNDKMPYALGDAVVQLDDIDFGYEVSTPLLTHNPGTIDDESLAIGQMIAERVNDGSTLQTGIGAVPDAVLSSLTHRRGLGVWTELMSDGALVLDKAGALDKERPIICSFLFGTQELYDWVDNNDRIRVMRTIKTNDPGLISQQNQMVSVNTALQIDLFLQANASRINNKIYSGTGGQTDFIVGAMHAPGGAAYLALKSWHPKANVSTVVGKLTEVTTSLQPSAVVTEQGIADMFCRTQQEQAHQLIEKAAHPNAREQLREDAVALGLFGSYPN